MVYQVNFILIHDRCLSTWEDFWHFAVFSKSVWVLRVADEISWSGDFEIIILWLFAKTVIFSIESSNSDHSQQIILQWGYFHISICLLFFLYTSFQQQSWLKIVVSACWEICRLQGFNQLCNIMFFVPAQLIASIGLLLHNYPCLKMKCAG